MGRSLVRAAFSLVVLASTTALAADGWTLNVTRAPGAESCADSPTLARAVEARLGRVVFEPGPAPGWEVSAEVARDGADWVADVVLKSGAGKRAGARTHRSPGDDCRALDDALSLIIAMLVSSPPPEVSAAEPPTAPPAPPASEDRRRAPALPPPVQARAPELLTGQLGVWPLFGVGQQAGPAAGVRVSGLFVLRETLGIETAAELWVPLRSTHAGLSLSVGSVALRAGVCPRVQRWGRVRVTACVGLLGGAYYVQVDGLAPGDTFAPLFDAVVRGQLSFALTSRLLLELGVGGGLRIARPTFAYVNAAGAAVPLYTAAPGTFDAGAGFSIEL